LQRLLKAGLRIDLILAGKKTDSSLFKIVTTGLVPVAHELSRRLRGSGPRRRDLAEVSVLGLPG
jgi:hypothetical protein